MTRVVSAADGGVTAHRPSFRSVANGLIVGITQLEEIGILFTLANNSDPRKSRRQVDLEDCPRLEHRENAVNCPFGTDFLIFTAVRVDGPVADCAEFEMTDGRTYAYAARGFVGKVDRAGGWRKRQGGGTARVCPRPPRARR